MLTVEKMKSRVDPRYIISSIVAWTLLSNPISKTFNSDNLIYAIGEIKTYAPDLFHGNVYMGEGVISPRLIVDIIFDGLMRLNGGDWAGAAIVWIYMGVVVQSFAVANIAYKINKRHQIVISFIFTCFVLYCDNNLAGFSLVALESTSIGAALAFSFLSISFLVGEKRNYKAAWIFATCAIFCHIHEGIYCCAVIFIFVLTDSIVRKKLLMRENAVVIVAITALMVLVIPNYLTDSMDISNADFVYIYSIFRHPHHLVPSTWGIDTIYKTIWIDISFFILSLTSFMVAKTEAIRQRTYEAVGFVLAWIIAILLMYVFTELKPIALISTMFFSKSFKYVLLIGLIWISKVIFDMRDRGCFLSSYSIICLVFTASTYELKQIALIVLFIVVLIHIEDYLMSCRKMIIATDILPITDVLFFILMVCVNRKILRINIGSLLKIIITFKSTMSEAMRSGLGQGTVVILVFVAITAITIGMRKKGKGYKFLCTLACFCMIGFSLLGKIVIYDNGAITLINGEKTLRLSLGNDLYDLAKDFKVRTNINEQFLADPNDTSNTGWFQIACERNCYVVYKVIPSSKSTVDIWYERYMKTTDFNNKTGEEIEDIMMSAKLKYVLVNAENYSKLDVMPNYSVFLSSCSDLFRIYQLN